MYILADIVKANTFSWFYRNFNIFFITTDYYIPFTFDTLSYIYIASKCELFHLY